MRESENKKALLKYSQDQAQVTEQAKTAHQIHRRWEILSSHNQIPLPRTPEASRGCRRLVGRSGELCAVQREKDVSADNGLHIILVVATKRQAVDSFLRTAVSQRYTFL